MKKLNCDTRFFNYWPILLKKTIGIKFKDRNKKKGIERNKQFRRSNIDNKQVI